MLRTTIYLEEKTAIALRYLSERQGCSQAELIRQAIDQLINEHASKSARQLPPGVGAYRSGRAHVSENAESLLKKRARRGR